MRSSKFLAKCQALSEAGFRPALEVGMFLGRGFADLGFELFSYLGQARYISLFTGQSAQINENEQSKLFAVPSCDEMVNEILKLGLDINSLDFIDQRHWKLSASDCRSREKFEFEADSLQDVLIDCLTARLRFRN